MYDVDIWGCHFSVGDFNGQFGITVDVKVSDTIDVGVSQKVKKCQKLWLIVGFGTKRTTCF